jgi:hypothetical protein
VFVAGCFAMPQQASPQDVRAMQRQAFMQSSGYPTKKTKAELDAEIARQTKDFTPENQHTEARLEAPAPYKIEGKRGTCYTIVMRLGDGATWGIGADAGLQFKFQTPLGPGQGGPGVIGPGAIASVGCAEADGPITLMMMPYVAGDPIGTGPLWMELWSHVLTKKEAEHLEADKQRQIREQQEFAAREAAKERDKETRGCARCDARYEGCIGAGRGRSVCRDEYGSCAFEEAGANYLSACPSPR